MRINKKTIVILLILALLIVGSIFIFNNNSKEYRNNLSKNDTFDMFIMLVEEGNYEEAKKFTTDDFNSNLSEIKKIKISNKNKDYNLSSENKFVYIDTYELENYKVKTNYYFELIQTTHGWKISNFYEDIDDKIEEINSLIN